MGNIKIKKKVSQQQHCQLTPRKNCDGLNFCKITRRRGADCRMITFSAMLQHKGEGIDLDDQFDY